MRERERERDWQLIHTGATALTLTPDCAHSKDMDLVRLSTPDLAAPV